MLKELQISMDNQIKSIKNYYNVLDNVISITDEHFNVAHNLIHPLAIASWSWEQYDIWIIENVIKDDVNCIFSIEIFDIDNEDGSVYASLDILQDNDGKFGTRGSLGSANNDTIIHYFTKIKEFVMFYKPIS